MLRFWQAVFALSICLAPVVVLAAEPIPRSVLILDSTEPNSPWGNEFRAILRSRLSVGAKTPVAIYSEVLDLAFSSPEFEPVLLTYLREKYRAKSIDVIVVHGSAALEIFMRSRSSLWPTVPVVFASVDEATVARLSLPLDITGITLQLRLSNMVGPARTLIPNLKQIVLVGDPYDRQPFRRHFVTELDELRTEFEIVDLTSFPLEEIRERVAALPATAAILFAPLYVDRAGAVYSPRDALKQISQAANRPIFSDESTNIGYGSVGGLMSVPEPVAHATGDLVWRVLNGESPASIQIATGNFIRPIFDWLQLQRFGLDEAKLPPGSNIYFKPPTIWEQYRWLGSAIIIIALFQLATITLLILERRRRLHAEAESSGRLTEVLHLNRTALAGVLSASFSHELNQPLGAILSNAEAAELLLFLSPPDLQQIREILADIRRDDQRAGDIIRHLGGLLKKKKLFELQEFDVNDAVRSAVNLLTSEASSRRVVLQTIQTQDALFVQADAVHLQQVILNLVLNAMDAMLDGAQREVTLKTELVVGKNEIKVSVADTGTGIPNDKLKDIFEPFFTTKPQGTGLGLSIARTIVENCGGRLWAENRLGGGAVFRFILPMAKTRKLIVV